MNTTAKPSNLFHLLLLLSVFFTIALTLKLSLEPNARMHFTADPHYVDFEGTYSLDNDSEPVPFNNETDFAEIPENYLMLNGHFTANILPNERMGLKPWGLAVQMYVNDELIYSCSEGDVPPNTPAYLFTKGINTSDRIQLKISSTSDSPDDFNAALRILLSNISSGENASIYSQNTSIHLGEIVSSLLIVMLGLLLLTASLFFLHKKLPNAVETLFFSAIILSCGLYFFTDYDSFLILVPYPGIMNALEQLCLGFIPLAIAAYLLTISKERLCQVLLTGAYAVFLLVQNVNLFLLFGGKVGYNDETYFNFSVILTVVSIILFFFCIIYEKEKGKNPRAAIIFLPALLMFGSMILDAVDYFLQLTSHSYYTNFVFLAVILFSIFHILQYVIQSAEQSLRSTELEKELLQSRISMMLSQIKPHFIFNTLNAISALCLTDPLKADETIVTFSEYLRENINALETQALIPFDKELHHVKNYVKIEQTRFGSKLSVEYNLLFTDFEVPTLSLQPVVENAVRHGIGKKQGNGTVWITSVKDGPFAVITVKDDGVGFDMNSDYKRQESVGMENIKTRLRAMVHAEISIDSQPGTGTCFTIRIPLNKEA